MSTFDKLTFAPMQDFTYEPMLVTDVFESMRAASKWFDLSKAISVGNPSTPYVARSGGGNGIGSFLPHQGFDPPNAGIAITIGVSTSTVFYQPVPFYTSKEIQVLRHHQLSAHNGLILVALLREQMSKFQWGNGASLERLKVTRIMVPVTIDTNGEQVVDWEGMTRLGKELLRVAGERVVEVRVSSPDEDDTLQDLIFEPMLITDVFGSIKASTAWYDKVSLKPGTGRNLYLSQTRESNSVAEIVADQRLATEPGNCITMTLKTQATFYQPIPFYTAQNFLIFRHPSLDVDSGMILVTAMRQAADKFSWGYGVSMARLSKTRIMVPVTIDTNGEQVVDWEGMSRYGRALRVRAECAMDAALENVVKSVAR